MSEENSLVTSPVSRTDSSTVPGDDTPADFKWEPVIYFYCIYILIILAGGVTDIHTSTAGGMIFLILLYGCYWQYLLNIKIDFLVLCVFICLILPVIPMITYDHKTLLNTYNELIKYYALNLIILLGLSLPLTPIARSRSSRLLYFILLVFLLAGWFWAVLHGSREPRVAGFLPNPNGFALTAMMLLFLTDEEKSVSWIKILNHAVVITLIYVSRTSGALLGYIFGICHRFVFAGGTRYIFLKIASLILLISLCTVFFLAIPQNTVKPVDATFEKIAVTREHLNQVLSEKKIDFYSLVEEKRGEDVTSGLWRIYQWNRIINHLRDSSIDKILFGYGIGTTHVIFKAKSHNDYLRILFETGVIGFSLNLAIWVILYRRMDIKYRWIVIMVAVFCITENNYDHFPAMSMLVFYMIGSGSKGLDGPVSSAAGGNNPCVKS